MKKILAALLLLPGLAWGQSYDGQGRLRVNDNITQIVGAAPSATNALPAQLSNGTSFIVPALDTTLTARFPVGSTPADNESNAVTITRSGAFVFVYDGATWDRWTGAVSQSGTWNVGTVTSITNSVAVTGTFWQATQPVSGTVTANAGTGTFAVSGPLTDTQLRATAVPVSGTFWQATQPVSGTVAATQSGTWTVQPGNTPNTSPWLFSIHDGTTKAAVFNLAANDPLAVAIVDGSGTQITSFGGGTQYTEGNTDASITGTAVMWEDTGDALAVASAAKPLPVNVVAGGAGDGAIQDGASPSIEATVLDFTNSNPLAVRLTDTNGDYVGAGAGTQYADGAAQATPTGTVALGHDGSNVRAITTDANGDIQTDILTMPAITGTVTANAGTGTFAVSGPLTDTQLRATSVPVSGTFWQATQPVSGTFWQATQPVSAASLPLPSGAATSALQDGIVKDGTGDTTQANVSGGRVHVDGSGVTQPVSGTFWQTTQPISIEQTGNNNAVDVLTVAPITSTGTITADSQSVTIDTQGYSTVGIQLSGTWTGTMDFQGTVDGTNWQTILFSSPSAVSSGVFGATANGIWVANVGGLDKIRVFGSDWVSGTVTVNLQASTGTTQHLKPTLLAAGQITTDLTTVGGSTVAVGNGTAATSLRMTVASDSTGTLAVQGTAAHDGTTLPVPMGLGAFAETPEDSDGNTNANRVSADADHVRLAADRNGTLYVRNGPPHRWAYHENSSSALTDTTVHASCGTGLYNYIESITASTGGATAFSIMIEDSTTATILGPYYLEAVAGRGLSVTYPGGRKQTNSATLISVTTTGAVAHGIDITGFCAP